MIRFWHTDFMISATKSSLGVREIKSLFNRIFPKIPVLKIGELEDGCFNASYVIQLDNRSEYVLKVAPPEDVPILTYEKEMMSTEVFFHKLLTERTSIPLPKLIFSHLKGEDTASDYFIMEKLHGFPLDKIGEVTIEMRKTLFLQLAGYLAQMHSIKGDYFGYPIMKESLRGQSYFESFLFMLDQVFHDGRVRNVSLPVPEKVLKELIGCFRNAFDEIKQSNFVHFDLWDGNIFVKNSDTNPEIEGLIDFERGFYGDPAADFSQVAGYIDLEKDEWFLEEYNRHVPVPFVLDKKAKNRIKLFRLYLFLIMVVESYYRDVEGSYNDQLKWSEGELVKLYEELKGMMV
ncbi:MAG: aminoglycoside phosphotransferase family protein [Spirochaetaceae bacterium]|nr:aminoglycoside phosphotransferase family protein [Spirochaetaceae bacterium]